MWAPIEDYALLADMRCAALVSRTGSIDWFCAPRFDSASIFAALLGDERHGMWTCAPVHGPRTVSRSYRAGTMIVDTEIASDDGRVRLTDLLVLDGDHPRLVRHVEGLEGSVDLHVQIVFSFDYGQIRPLVHEVDDRLIAVAGPDAVVLDSDLHLHQHEQSTVADVVVEAGDQLTTVLTHVPSSDPVPGPIDGRAAITETTEAWREWSHALEYDGDWPEFVERSVLTMRSLSYRRAGSLVTSPTSSLPEQLGGVRNFDYRYCWLRDSSFTVYALMRDGFHHEAEAWRRWLIRATARRGDNLQPVFGVMGERRIAELTADWLPGYEGSTPVNFGNRAASQFQLDVFGEVVDALYECRRMGLAPDDDAWALQQDIARVVSERWVEPGQGIWELRGPPRQYTHSKVMAWLAIDRCIRMVEEFDREVGARQLADWRDLRTRIHREVCEQGFDDQLGSFVQYYGSDVVDASLLLMVQYGFLPPDDARMVGTVERIQRDLVDDGWVWRYDTTGVDDGLPEGEGAFLACQCWLADALILMERREEAVEVFQRVLDVANDVGLLAEEYDPRTHRLVGNFPLALTHLAAANTARNLIGAGPAHHRSAPALRDLHGWDRS